ncbi:hypothetical protein [Paenibacillus polymyxa]|uniref:hypothetical protein n=1 Tax=Paenibacillus polymyxa TaxID=1406 RepID=UPI003D2BC553
MSRTFGKYNIINIHSLADTPKNEQESNDYANALAQGNYPAGLDGCFTVGISGGCGPDCWVYQNGECGEPNEMLDRLTSDELEEHYQLYPRKVGSTDES